MGAVAATRRKKRRYWQLGILSFLLLVCGSIAGGVVWLDTAAGHRFLVDQINSLRPQSGLRISIARIEGSIFKRAAIRELRLADSRGTFFAAPDVRLSWWPGAWLANRLDIDSLRIGSAHLSRLPKLKSQGGSVLPDFDIRLMEARVDRLSIGPAVTGTSEVWSLTGDADVRSGRAVVDLNARSHGGDDRFSLALASRPDDNRFDVDLTVNAAKGGVLARLVGVSEDTNVRIKGDGDWRKWQGTLVATVNAKPAAGFALSARQGRFAINGAFEQPLLTEWGIVSGLASPRLKLEMDALWENRSLHGQARLSSSQVTVDATGGLNLRRNEFDNLKFDIRMARSAPAFAGIEAGDAQLLARLDGPFAQYRLEYLLKAPSLRKDRLVLRDVVAKGTATYDARKTALHLPLALTVGSVEGQGDMVSSALKGLSLNGWVNGKGLQLSATGIVIRSAQMTGSLDAVTDLARGSYELDVNGDLAGLVLPGVGQADIATGLKVWGGGNHAPMQLEGAAEARFRRIDSDLIRSLAGGLPRLRTRLSLAASGRLILPGLNVDGPALQLSGNGERLANGDVLIRLAGQHARYGAAKLVLSGPINRPRMEIGLARPFDALGLSNVSVLLDPVQAGYQFSGKGGSSYGDFDAAGLIALGGNRSALITLDVLHLADIVARGTLQPVGGELVGTLDLTGALQGKLVFAGKDGRQQISANLVARNARFDTPTRIFIRSATIEAIASFRGGESSLEADIQARGLAIGGFRANQFAAAGQIVNGEGNFTASLSGQQGRSFSLQMEADVSPGEWAINAHGTLDHQAILLDGPARIRREANGAWSLAPSTIRYRGGSARLSGLTGRGDTRLDMALNRIPLTILDLSNANLGFGGYATGQLNYAQQSGGLPSGKAQLTIRNFSRSGVTRTSLPLDFGLNATFGQGRLGVRAVAANKGAEVGRAQALFTQIGRGALWDEVRRAQVQAQLRFNGPAEALWRLSGVEFIDLTGPVRLGANVRGSLAQPSIDGALATSNLTLVSPVTGMHVTGVKASGRFNGNELYLPSITGTTRGGGSLSGQGRFDFSAVQGVAMDVSLQASNAEILNRDDIGALVTGPITLKSSGVGGVIGGNLDITRSRFTLGRAASVSQIPQLQLIERNGQVEDFDPKARASVWSLDLQTHAERRLMVDGLGLNSEWGADLHIGGSALNPQLTGSAELLRGTYDFAGRRFDMKSGKLRFDGRTPVNPTLDISAEATVSDLTATIHVTGTSMNPVISFTSIPALPEDEVLSRILFGSSITKLSAPEALQLASAIASLQGKGGGLDPINAVRKVTGLDRLRIVPADTTTGQKTSVSAGKYINRNTYVEIVTDGQGYSATRIEYQVTRWLSLLASISNIGRQSGVIRISKDY